MLGARYWRLAHALLAGTALFGAAVLVAWRVQEFTPSVRDLAWLVVVVVADTCVSSRHAPQRDRRAAA